MYNTILTFLYQHDAELTPTSAFFSCYGLNAGFEPRFYGIYATRRPRLRPPHLCSLSFWFLLSPSPYNIIFILFERIFTLVTWIPKIEDFTVFSVLRRVFSLSFWTFPLHRVDLYLYYVFVSVFMFCTGMCSCIYKWPRAQYCVYIYTCDEYL